MDNLLSNAVKFSPARRLHPYLDEQDSRDGSTGYLDAGLGVDEADREKVFEPFYQGRRDTRQPYQGNRAGAVHRARVCASAWRQYRAYAAGMVGAHFRLTLPVRDPEGPRMKRMRQKLRILAGNVVGIGSCAARRFA